MATDIDSENIIDTALDFGSDFAERKLKKMQEASKQVTPDVETLDKDQLTPPPVQISESEPKPTTLEKIDELGQKYYRNYDRLRDDLDDGDTIHAVRTGLKIGRDLVGGNIGRSIKIGGDAIGFFAAVKNGNLEEAFRLGVDILKAGAHIAFGTTLSTKEQMICDRLKIGLDNIAPNNHIQQTIKNEVNQFITQAQEMYKLQKDGQSSPAPTEWENLNNRINEMRKQQLAAEMKRDAENMPPPEIYFEQNYTYELPPATQADENTIAAVDTKETKTQQSLTPAQMKMLDKSRT